MEILSKWLILINPRFFFSWDSLAQKLIKQADQINFVLHLELELKSDIMLVHGIFFHFIEAGFDLCYVSTL